MEIDVLIGCEESQAVTKAFRELGIRAYSCDVLPESGGMPEWHIKDDVFKVVANHPEIRVGIFFPPCTHLAVSGAAHFAKKRADGRQQQGIDFFMELTKLEFHFAIENPIGIMSRLFRKPDQIIHPYQFGHLEQKSTCLWLKGLPKLTETNNVKDEMMQLPRKERERIHFVSPGPERSKIRSKTFEGIAKAMATQWAETIRKSF